MSLFGVLWVRASHLESEGLREMSARVEIVGISILREWRARRAFTECLSLVHKYKSHLLFSGWQIHFAFTCLASWMHSTPLVLLSCRDQMASPAPLEDCGLERGWALRESLPWELLVSSWCIATGWVPAQNTALGVTKARFYLLEQISVNWFYINIQYFALWANLCNITFYALL